MTDIIAAVIILVLVGAAIAYIIREKKRGVKCIGCPDGAACAAKSKCSGGCGSCSGNCTGCGSDQ